MKALGTVYNEPIVGGLVTQIVRHVVLPSRGGLRESYHWRFIKTGRDETKASNVLAKGDAPTSAEAQDAARKWRKSPRGLKKIEAWQKEFVREENQGAALELRAGPAPTVSVSIPFRGHVIVFRFTPPSRQDPSGLVEARAGDKGRFHLVSSLRLLGKLPSVDNSKIGYVPWRALEKAAKQALRAAGKTR